MCYSTGASGPTALSVCSRLCLLKNCLLTNAHSVLYCTVPFMATCVDAIGTVFWGRPPTLLQIPLCVTAGPLEEGDPSLHRPVLVDPAHDLDRREDPKGAGPKVGPRFCCDMGQNDTIGKIELNPSFVLSSDETNCKNDIQLFHQLFDELRVNMDYH